MKEGDNSVMEMTIEQYSRVQRCLGVLEGIGFAVPDAAADSFYDAIETMDTIITEVYKGQEATK